MIISASHYYRFMFQNSCDQSVKLLLTRSSLYLSMANVTEKVSVKLTRLSVTGWRREVVIRGVQDLGSASRKCDIYYYTPENRKLVCHSLIDLTCCSSLSS